MTSPFQQWKVLPHGELVKIDERILSVVGQIQMPLMKLPRRMTVVRLEGGRLVIFSAIALDDVEMATIEAFGDPAYLVVPNDRHRLDAKIWKDRYPAMQVVAPEGSRAKVAELVPVDTTAPHFGDAAVDFVTVSGTLDREAALVVRASGGATLVLNDVVGNIRDSFGIGGWLLSIAGFAGETPHIPAVVRMSMIKDRNALRAQLLQWSGIESLRRILVSHGASIEENPRQVLRDLALSLG